MIAAKNKQIFLQKLWQDNESDKKILVSVSLLCLYLYCSCYSWLFTSSINLKVVSLLINNFSTDFLQLIFVNNLDLFRINIFFKNTTSSLNSSADVFLFSVRLSPSHALSLWCREATPCCSGLLRPVGLCTPFLSCTAISHSSRLVSPDCFGSSTFVCVNCVLSQQQAPYHISEH